MLKKVVTVFLILCMVTPVLANYNLEVTKQTQGIVIEVVDGDAIRVRLYTGGQALIRLAGIKTEGNDMAYEFLRDYLTGKQVTLVPEKLIAKTGRFNFCYVYTDDNGALLNYMLVEQGYAKAEMNHSYATLISGILDKEYIAKTKKVGIWDTGTGSYYISAGRYHYTGDMVNINTATREQLVDLLRGVTSPIASEIVSYRNKNPFNTVYELKFVPGMTKDIFDNIIGNITVATDLNEATKYELLTLKEMTEKFADEIIKERDYNDFDEAEDIYNRADLDKDLYSDNKYFIYVTSTEKDLLIDYAIPSTVVNINTASKKQLESVSGITSRRANEIMDTRDNYTFKFISELFTLDSFTNDEDEINAYEDNLHVMTDLNYASRKELESLFVDDYSYSEITKIMNERPYDNVSELKQVLSNSDYEEIYRFCTVEGEQKELMNINRVTLKNLTDLGMSTATAERIIDEADSIKEPSDIDVDISRYEDKLSIYTNINTASEKELNALHKDMSDITPKILEYRKEQPFGSLTEIEILFREESKGSIFFNIEDLLVVR